MYLKLMEVQLHNNQEMVCQLLLEGPAEDLCAVCSMHEQKEHRGTICEDFIYTCQTNPHFLICIRYFSMFPEQNIRALSGTQNHHQGPKGFTDRSKAAKLF